MWELFLTVALILGALWLIKKNFFIYSEQDERRRTERFLAGYHADKKPRQQY